MKQDHFLYNFIVFMLNFLANFRALSKNLVKFVILKNEIFLSTFNSLLT